MCGRERPIRDFLQVKMTELHYLLILKTGHIRASCVGIVANSYTQIISDITFKVIFAKQFVCGTHRLYIKMDDVSPLRPTVEK